jgi:hypothetical protein
MHDRVTAGAQCVPSPPGNTYPAVLKMSRNIAACTAIVYFEYWPSMIYTVMDNWVNPPIYRGLFE